MSDMMNLDKFKEQKAVHINAMAEAFRSGEEDKIKAACENWQNFMTEEIKSAAELYSATADKSILAARGVRQLTQAETKFYEKFISSAKNEGVITGIENVLPETILESIVQDIRREHELLNLIDFKYTSAVTKWIINAKGSQTATWDELNTPITTKLEGAIEIIDLTLCKLTSCMFCTLDMLQLGPVWVDAYVRATLSEGLAVGLENAIVNGTGKKEPIGMTRNFTGTYNTSTGFPLKAATKITDFGPATYGSILSKIAFTGEMKDSKNGSVTPNPANGNSRNIRELILIVNPVDYFAKVMPATTVLTPVGKYASDVFPVETKVVRSSAVASNRAIIGDAKLYFMGIGKSTSASGKIEYSDEYKFLEDLRTYKTKMYGNGRPIDMNSFEVLDISEIQPVNQKVEVVNVVKTKEQ